MSETGGIATIDKNDGQMIIGKHETSAIAVATQAKALVEARFLMAINRPRNWDMVRQSIMRDCKRPRFAASARYHKPVGKKGIEGPSIRFVEAALRAMGNVDVSTPALYDDADKRNIRINVCDLESNTTYSQDVVVTKVVERKTLRQGQSPISARTNSYGDRVYLVVATDDEILNKQNALISKAVRTLGLRLVPGDITDEAMDVVRATVNDAHAQDPDAARKKLFDAFAALGVKASDIAEYVGHDVATMSPSELTHLRALHQAISDGETTWFEATDHKSGGKDKPAKATGSLKDKVKAKAAAAREPGQEG